jgi:hypothetical protein
VEYCHLLLSFHDLFCQFFIPDISIFIDYLVYLKANNTEIIAILSSGFFHTLLRPYIIGASLISVFVLIMGFYVVPASSEGFNNFRYTYLKEMVPKP